MQNKIFIRVDGGEKIGLGHIMRCIAIGYMLKTDFEIHFVSRQGNEATKLEIKQAGFSYSEIHSEDEFFEMLSGNEIVILDNYFFDVAYQQAVKAKGSKLVCIDDIGDRYFVADAVINHGGGITKKDYAVAAYTLLYLGPEYRLLRKQFQEYKRIAPERNENIFLCLGGADPENVTLDILEQLSANFDNKNVFCVIGSANNNYEKLKNFSDGSSLKVQLLQNLDADQMVHYMSICSTAITSASTTAYEYLTIGGELYVIKTADNQKKLFEYLIASSLAKEFLTNNFAGLSQSATVNAVFDKSSALHVAKIFNLLNISQSSVVRRANVNDVELAYKWINDPEVRNNSHSQNEIAFEDHTKWFNNVINRPSTYYYIVENENVPYGQIRFEKSGDEVVINYLIAPEFRGKGFGQALVQLGIEQVLKDAGSALNIIAYVKTENAASNKIFERLPFNLQRLSEHPGSNKYYYSFLENERN